MSSDGSKGYESLLGSQGTFGQEVDADNRLSSRCRLRYHCRQTAPLGHMAYGRPTAIFQPVKCLEVTSLG